MDRTEFLNGPVNEVYMRFHNMLDEIDAPEELHEEYKLQFIDSLYQIFMMQDYITKMKEAITERYGEEVCKEIADIVIERLNIDYDYPATKNGIRKKEGNILMFPGVIWEEDKEKEKDKEE